MGPNRLADVSFVRLERRCRTAAGNGLRDLANLKSGVDPNYVQKDFFDVNSFFE